MPTIDETLSLASQHHAAGNLHQAEYLYKLVIQAAPHLAPVHHLLGIVQAQQGHLEPAMVTLRQAVKWRPDFPEAHNDLANLLQVVGKLDEAVAHYQQAIRNRPEYAEAHNNLGATLAKQGKLDAAVLQYRQAIRSKPDYANAHFNLADTLNRQGKLDEAIGQYRRALDFRPAFAEAWNGMGISQQRQGRLGEAVQSFRQALGCRPQFAEARANLGGCLAKLGDLAAAIACYEEALRINPNMANAQVNLGNALHKSGRSAEAVQCFFEALQLDANNVEAHTNLGITLMDLGQLEEAVASQRKALEIDPACFTAYVNLGAAHERQREYDTALTCYRRAVEIHADVPTAYLNIAGVLSAQGKVHESIPYLRHAIQLKPDYAEAHSNLVYLLHFCPEVSAQAIYQEHRLWNELHAERFTQTTLAPGNERSASRTLRIGYVSPDFRWHPVGRFVLPLLEAHDQANVEIACYASQRGSDEITAACRKTASIWRDVAGFTDEQVAHLVRQDGIDILVDLTMHMVNGRPLLFARKPAPVQVTYLAYCSTTGLTAMDYRLTDPYLDPPDADLSVYSEQSVRLPRSYWCYREPLQASEVTALPALTAGHVTFGCLNNFSKCTEPTLAAWGQLLRALPSAHLLLHAYAGSHRERVRDYFAQWNIGPERLGFVDFLPAQDFFRFHKHIDIGLDPFPYTGGTTTCDALWMGVPVVSLAGQAAVGRSGLSIMSNIGLGNLVAKDIAGYVAIACELAADLTRLSELRMTLRARMRQSPLMDAASFAADVEAAYRMMWKEWCELSCGNRH